MTIAIALVSALLLLAVSLSDAQGRAQRREQALRNDPADLNKLHAERPPFLNAGTVLSCVVALAIAYHLVFPSGIGQLRSRLSALALAAAGTICAAHLLINVSRLVQGESHRDKQRPQDERRAPTWIMANAAFLLLTLAICSLATMFAPRDAYLFTSRAYLSRLVALAIMTAFWSWLAGMWKQQLDGGRAWTTAGKLIPLARAMALVSAVLAIATGAQMVADR